MDFAGTFPELSNYLTSSSDFELPTESQRGIVTCHDCWLQQKRCDLTPLNQHTNSAAGCVECSEAGVICHIPVSDTALIHQGFNTAVDGRRKCLICAMTDRQCVFPLGQRPNPCLSCVQEGRVSCRILPALPTDAAYLLEGPDDAPAYSVVNGMSLQQFDMMLPGPQTEFPHLEEAISGQDFGGMNMMLSQEQQDNHLFDLPPDTEMSLSTTDTEFPWLETESEFSETPRATALSGILPDQTDYATYTADTPHSMYPSMDFSVGLTPENTPVSETVKLSDSQEVQQDAGFLDQEQQMALSGDYQSYGDEIDIALSQDMFSPNVW